MPTYEFRCPRGHEFEKFYRTISGAEAQAACPECGELAERILSPAGFAFKGSGFYLTDYGKNAHREKGTVAKSTGSDSSSSDNSTAKSDAGSNDAKPEGAKSGGESASPSTSSSTSPAPAAESKPAPKKSTGE